jgi:hypothetical protein
MKISPKRVAGVLFLIVFVLILLDFVTQTLRIYGGHQNQLGFQRQFNLDEENNIPTWVSSSMLLACSLLLGLIGWAKRGAKGPDARRWLALAAIFLCLSMDEGSSLHEMTSPLGYALLQRTGPLNSDVLFYSWLPFGIAAIAVIGFIYLPFLRDLPKDTRQRFLQAGCVYISGAVITEMAAAAVAYRGGVDNSLLSAIEVATEEGLEMLGIIAFVYGLLMHLRREDVSTAVLQRLLQLFKGDEAAATATASVGDFPGTVRPPEKPLLARVQSPTALEPLSLK